MLRIFPFSINFTPTFISSIRSHIAFPLTVFPLHSLRSAVFFCVRWVVNPVRLSPCRLLLSFWGPSLAYLIFFNVVIVVVDAVNLQWHYGRPEAIDNVEKGHQTMRRWSTRNGQGVSMYICYQFAMQIRGRLEQLKSVFRLWYGQARGYTAFYGCVVWL